MNTPFAAILHSAVAHTPGALGGSLAAATDGETVDYVAVSALPGREQPASMVSAGRGDDLRSQWELLTAHHGVLLEHIRSALRTYHFGDVESLVVSHGELHLLMRRVDGDYYAVMALSCHGQVARGLRQLDLAATRLRQEMLA